MRIAASVALATLGCGRVALATLGCGRVHFDNQNRDGGADAIDIAAGPFGPPSVIEALSSPADEQEPTLTADRLELVFRRGYADLFVSRRDSVADPWGPPSLIVELSTTAEEITPAISADGLTLWFCTPSPVGDYDVYVTTRPTRSSPWSPPAQVSSINTGANEFSPSVPPGEQQLLLGRSGDLYTARRDAADWTIPTVIEELSTVDDEGAPRLWAGGTQIMFQFNGSGSTSFDLRSSERATSDGVFGPTRDLAELNSPAIDWDAWITEDGHYIVFGSDRSGNQEIYEALR
ncbi:MAG: hypothetical protein ACKV2T_00430 [Kofleriaceae bacterium]